MTSDFPYYLALFGLVFFISVICCCIKLIDIIDRPVPRPSNMPSWNYANYLQNSPVAILSPQPDPFLRCAMMAENHGLSVEEFLTTTATGPGLYSSVSSSYGNAMNHRGGSSHLNSRHMPPPPPPAPAPSPNPQTPPMISSYHMSVPEDEQHYYRIPIPEQDPPPLPLQRRLSMPEVNEIPTRPTRSRRSLRRERSMDREYLPKYEDICFDV